MPVTTQEAGRWTQCLAGSVNRTFDSDTVTIGVLPGEGIGPEVTRCTLNVLRAIAETTGTTIDARYGGPIGRQSEARCGLTLTDEVIAFCQSTFDDGGSILNGPGGGRYVYELRREFDLFFKISPLQICNAVADASPVRAATLQNADILVTRENSGGVYQGESRTEANELDGQVVRHAFSYSERQVQRFLDASARLAASRAGELTVVWKESGVPGISELWRDCAQTAATATGIRLSLVDVDLMAYRLILEPAAFDVIAAPNLCGDVLADLGATLLGSRGLSYSGNFRADGRAVYQTNHGAAYDLAGHGTANPGGQLLSAAMMLRESFEMEREAAAIEYALQAVWQSGLRTKDVAVPGCQVVTTDEIAQRVAEYAVDILQK